MMLLSCSEGVFLCDQGNSDEPLSLQIGRGLLIHSPRLLVFLPGPLPLALARDVRDARNDAGTHLYGFPIRAARV
jgi:hypothetical protein